MVLGYDLEKKDDRDPLRPHVKFNPGLSLGWLIYRQGPYFEKNSFRLGIGKTDLVHDILSLEPRLFFSRCVQRGDAGAAVERHILGGIVSLRAG